MALELIGGALISSSVQLLLERIVSPDVLNHFRRNNDSDSEALLKKLKIMVRSLAAVLDDAEQRQIRNDPRVKDWLDELEEAVLDADDLFDEMETDILSLKVENQFGTRTSEVRETTKHKFLNKIKKILSLFMFDRCGNSNNGNMDNNINKILNRLAETKKQIKDLGLKENVVGVRPWESKRAPSTSLVDEVYGRETDKEVLIKLLMSDPNGGYDKIGVIPIWGMGGLGKTTLAQAVFNHHQVRDHFELKAWVCVSQEYDLLRVTKDILNEVSSLHGIDVTNLNTLQVKLKDALAGKKFLIVLDDVWNDNYDDWTKLRMPFNDGAQGSKILVSTRSNKVAHVMGTVESHQLKRLGDEACWKLFTRHASGIGDSTANPNLERIGREIVFKCKGLPLAVKILGGLLRSTLDVREWERVSNSDIWGLTEREIHPALRLSYNYLPSPLKRCFAYCSIFPTDYEFKKEKLILLWMAENLLYDPKGIKKMEEVGDEYFNELVTRSFLQPIYGFKGSFIMHDLLVDFAKFVSKNCFLLENNGSSNVNVTQARHISHISNWHNPFGRCDSIYGAANLRTFLPLPTFTKCCCSKEALGDLFMKLKRLRVLSFSCCKVIEKIPDSICELRHLRYLNLSYTSISWLPQSIISLYNLQTLDFYFCHFLKELPKNFHHLVSLRYLDVRVTMIEKLPSSLSLMSNLHTLLLCDSLKEMPTQTSRLKNLERLSFFMVGKDEGKKIVELGQLSHLRGRLQVINLENVATPEDALEAKLREMKYLEELIFQWSRDHETANDASMHEKKILENLVPNSSLKVIEIKRYGGKEFPNWLGNLSFCNIVDIRLRDCHHCMTLPALGQLSSLKSLDIRGLNALVNVGLEFYGDMCLGIKAFPSLEELFFEDLPNWKEWSIPDGDVEAFPKLRKLSLLKCVSLAGDLHFFLPELTHLEISPCGRLTLSLPKMPKLTSLSLEHCSEKIIKSMEALESCTCLQSLTITSEDFFSLQVKCPPKTLTSLYIRGCENVESLWASTLFFLPTLTSLTLENCKKLKFLPEEMRSLLPSLEWLELCNCMELESFPTSGLPSTLSKLFINKCDKLLASRKTWNLHTLSNLIEFRIYESECEDMVSFPEEGLLPTTLTSLRIWEMKCVERLNGKGLQQLKSLKYLYIYNCYNLKALTEEEGLPSSLNFLWINKCPLLEEKYKRETGEYWNIISHIPNIEINNRTI